MGWFFDDEGTWAETRRRGLAAVSLLTLLFLPAVESQAADLFTPVNEPPPRSIPADDPVLRRRVVTIDFEQLQSGRAAAGSPGRSVYTKDAASSTKSADSIPTPGTTLTFNLFDDTVVTGIVEQTAPTFSGGYSVSGRIIDEPPGSMTLVVNGETVAGTVRLLDGTYYIRSAGDGLYAISEVEEPPLDCGVGEPHFETDHDH